MLRLLLAGAARRHDQPFQAGRGRQHARVPGGRSREAAPRPGWGAEPQQFSGEVLLERSPQRSGAVPSEPKASEVLSEEPQSDELAVALSLPLRGRHSRPSKGTAQPNTEA